jgi:hypothetical protein
MCLELPFWGQNALSKKKNTLWFNCSKFDKDHGIFAYSPIFGVKNVGLRQKNEGIFNLFI